MHKVISTEKLRNKTVLNTHPSSYHVVANNTEVCMLVKMAYLVCVCMSRSPHISAAISNVLYIVSLVYLACSILYFSPRLTS